MKISVTTRTWEVTSSDLVVLPILEGRVTVQEKLLNSHLGGLIFKLRSSKDVLAEKSKTRLIYDKDTSLRILIVGLGKVSEISSETLREAMGMAVNNFKSLPVKIVSILVPDIPKIPIYDVVTAFTEALILASYKFPFYKKIEDESRIEEIQIVVNARDGKRCAEAAKTAEIIAQSVCMARDLGNHPSNIATPSHLAEHAVKLGKQFKSIKVKIWHRDEIQKQNMNALLAVAQGSDQEPKFIILEYRGASKTRPSVVLVGKGITFDSGGISIKPSDKMEEMKYDMMGAATVMATVRAAAELKLPVNLVGLIPATENLPSGKAIKPGDIIRARNGKTIEVVNTDAEGRLILADALDYAKTYKPALVIDFATLTGAIVVALGDDLVGAFSNKSSLLEKFDEAAKITGEKIWPMPLEKDYEQFIKSDFADLRNIGTMRYGDSIMGALFLQNFVDYPWIHLDIAGTAWTTREKPYRPKGATGIGVRSTIEFLKRLKK